MTDNLTYEISIDGNNDICGENIGIIYDDNKADVYGVENTTLKILELYKLIHKLNEKKKNDEFNRNARQTFRNIFGSGKLIDRDYGFIETDQDKQKGIDVIHSLQLYPKNNLDKNDENIFENYIIENTRMNRKLNLKTIELNKKYSEKELVQLLENVDDQYKFSKVKRVDNFIEKYNRFLEDINNESLSNELFNENRDILKKLMVFPVINIETNDKLADEDEDEDKDSESKDDEDVESKEDEEKDDIGIKECGIPLYLFMSDNIFSTINNLLREKDINIENETALTINELAKMIVYSDQILQYRVNDSELSNILKDTYKKFWNKYGILWNSMLDKDNISKNFRKLFSKQKASSILISESPELKVKDVVGKSRDDTPEESPKSTVAPSTVAPSPEPSAERPSTAEPSAERPSTAEAKAPAERPSAERPSTAEAKAPAERPSTAEAKASAERPSTAEAKAPAERPSTAEAKAPAEPSAERPSTAEAKAPAERPSTAEAKAPAERPSTAEPSAERPSTAEAKAPAERPSTAEAKAPTERPSTAKAPAERPSTAEAKAPAERPSTAKPSAERPSTAEPSAGKSTGSIVSAPAGKPKQNGKGIKSYKTKRLRKVKYNNQSKRKSNITKNLTNKLKNKKGKQNNSTKKQYHKK
jgi:hypothetical protein